MAKPQLPARVDPELYAYLKYLRDRVTLLEKRLGAGEDEELGTDDDASPLGFEPIYVTPASLADQGAGTEGAWTTLTPSAPSGARYATIIFEVRSTDDADVGKLEWRTESGAAEIMAVEVNSDEDDAQPRIVFFVPLTSGGSFQYFFTNTSTTTIDWSITYVGYVI